MWLSLYFIIITRFVKVPEQSQDMMHPVQWKPVLTAAIVSAVVSAVVTVSLQKYLDVKFPTPIESFTERDRPFQFPTLSRSYTYSGYANQRSRFLGFTKNTPIYYFELTLGNTLDVDTGVISISIDYPSEVSSVAVSLPDRTLEFENESSVHFQVSSLKPRSGYTFTIVVKGNELPDINKTDLDAVSQAGEFSNVPRSLYDEVFHPVEPGI